MRNPWVLHTLLEALQDVDAWMRMGAAKGLGQIGTGNEEAIYALLAALRGVDKRLCATAAKSLGLIGAGNETVVSGLLAALQDAVFLSDRVAADRYLYRQMRLATAKSLGLIGAGNKAMTRILLEGLQNRENRDIRLVAAQILGEGYVGEESVVSALLAALQDTDREVRWRVADSLGQMGVGLKPVVAAQLKALRDPENRVRRGAAVILGQMEIKDPKRLRRAPVSLNHHLYEWGSTADDVLMSMASFLLDHLRYANFREGSVREAILKAIRRQLDGRSFPDSHWVPLQHRRARARRRRRIAVRSAFVTAVAVFLTLLGLSAAGVLDAGSLPIFKAQLLVHSLLKGLILMSYLPSHLQFYTFLGEALLPVTAHLSQ